MSDFSEAFKNKLRKKTEGLEVSSPSNFLTQISEELKHEQENDKVFQFKKSLSKSLVETKQKVFENSINIFENQLSVSILTEENQQEETVLEIEKVEPIQSIQEDYISTIVNCITKEEVNKSVQEHTDLFNQPNSKKPDPTIKALQDKVKYIENWVYKISAEGPGSGEVNFRWLDDVNRDTIGNTDQILRYNSDDKKFFFGQLSGDQGPIRSLEFDVNGAGITPGPQTLEWNTEKDCLNIYQTDNSKLQVGLENFIRVHNITGNTLTKGTFVQFSGVNGDGETPTCVPFIANSSSTPLYSIGLLTRDIPDDGYGRASILGEIRDLDTTGSDVSEVWQEGDLLWASPHYPGKLTKAKPIAPDVVISVAAVIKANSTNGLLLTRPTIFPRLYYGPFFDNTNQTANTINTPYAIRYSNTQISSGFHIANNTHVVAEYAGLYNYQFSLQIDSTNAASSQNIWIWYRKNGQNVPATSTKITVNKEFKVAAWNFIESMEIGEYFQLMWATDSTTVKIVAPGAESFCPSIPSVILTVTQVNL